MWVLHKYLPQIQQHILIGTQYTNSPDKRGSTFLSSSVIFNKISDVNIITNKYTSCHNPADPCPRRALKVTLTQSWEPGGQGYIAAAAIFPLLLLVTGLGLEESFWSTALYRCRSSPPSSACLNPATHMGPALASVLVCTRKETLWLSFLSPSLPSFSLPPSFCLPSPRRWRWLRCPGPQDPAPPLVLHCH